MAKYSKFKQKVHPIAYVIGVLFLALIAVVIIFTVPSKSEKSIVITQMLKGSRTISTRTYYG